VRSSRGQRPAVRGWRALAITAVVFFLGAETGRAAELRLRSQCTGSGPLITLGDVAEIFAAEGQPAHTLAAIELFPAPVASRQRFLSVREIQDLLVLRGVNLAEHRFSGSSQVTILAAAEPTRAEAEPALSAAAAKRAERRLRDAVIQYLQEHASAEGPWTVQLNLSPGHSRLLANSNAKIALSGGAAPWTGTQRFEVKVDTPEQPLRFTLEAEVAVPSAAVAAIRSLGRGVVIRQTDVELQRGASREGGADLCYSIDEVVGKETTRAIAAGKALSRDALRAPLLVHRGEVVTVSARSSGIRVRTTARARDDGSLGDLIAVESLQDRATYFARVSAVREVEVFAHSTRAEGVAVDKLLPLTARKSGD
jgi:flagella basal body P-ring formation protein FlgA